MPPTPAAPPPPHAFPVGEPSCRNSAPPAAPSPAPTGLTPEDRARAEQNRRAALERRAAKQGGGGGTQQGTQQGAAASGSTLRETTSDRWAAAHYPTTPYVTRAWHTEQTAITRIWHQHFECCALCVRAGVRSQECVYDRPHCLYCLVVHHPARDSPFCGDRCASAYSAAQSQGSARDQLFERERGVCQACAFDAHSFYKRVRALPSEQARFQELMASPYSVDSGRLKRMLSDPKEGDFWEADRTYLSCFQLSEASCAAMRRRMIAVS